jgi:hypothetical protein
MRRQDREITDPQTIAEIIERCECLRMGLCDQGDVYIVPLNFGYFCDNGQYSFYFHGAKVGRKLDLIRSNPRVGFEMDCNVKVHTADVACRCATQFQSIIGNGIASIVTDPTEKHRGLIAIMRHYTGKIDWDIPQEAVDAVCVFKLVPTNLSCKQHD